MDRKKQNRRLASHATDAPSLSRRIEDMENRLMVERAQVVAHTREFQGSVRRRLTSPTSLVFAGSMGFIAAEIIGARSGRRGGKKSKLASAGKSAGKTLFGILAKPLGSVVQLASAGFLAKQSKDMSETMQTTTSESISPPTLH
ncbi:MAG TPA: hypothetical protein VF275_00550 [Gammaproteobacteria bacterium]